MLPSSYLLDCTVHLLPHLSHRGRLRKVTAAPSASSLLHTQFQPTKRDNLPQLPPARSSLRRTP